MTEALKTLIPVLFMIALGYISKVSGMITPEQKDGANTVIFSIFFPLMIFNLLVSSEIKPDLIWITIYILVCYLIFFALGKTLLRKIFHPYEKISPYLLTTAEGGNLAVPLYLSLVPGSANPILLDIAGIIFCFVLIPVLITFDEAGAKKTPKQIFFSILENRYVDAAVLGIVCNVTGLYSMLAPTDFGQIYSAVISLAVSPIIGIILFIIGYNLDFSWNILRPAIKLTVIRVFLFSLIITGFFLLFPDRMADSAFLLAVLLYFLGPVGFGVILQIEPLMTSSKEEAYASGIISLNILVVLFAYILMVLWKTGLIG